MIVYPEVWYPSAVQTELWFPKGSDPLRNCKLPAFRIPCFPFILNDSSNVRLDQPVNQDWMNCLCKEFFAMENIN